MPPKTNKVVEDKTFGLKNKNKSAKVSRYVENVKNQAKQAGQSRKDMVTILIGPLAFESRIALHHNRLSQ
jgi:hypothetical protein